MSNIEEKRLIEILISLELALSRAIVPSLWAVTFDWTEDTILLYFFSDGEVSEDDREESEIVATETSIGFNDFPYLHSEFINIHNPEKLPSYGKEIVFAREEAKNKWPISEFLKKKCNRANLIGDWVTKSTNRLMITINYALLGRVTAALRAVTCDLEADALRMYYFFDGEISESNRTNAEEVSAIVLQELKELTSIKTVCIRADAPALLPLFGKDSFGYVRRDAGFEYDTEGK